MDWLTMANRRNIHQAPGRNDNSSRKVCVNVSTLNCTLKNPISESIQCPCCLKEFFYVKSQELVRRGRQTTVPTRGRHTMQRFANNISKLLVNATAWQAQTSRINLTCRTQCPRDQPPQRVRRSWPKAAGSERTLLALRGVAT